MCNLFNTLFGRNVNGSCGCNTWNSGCSCCNQWICGWQRVCRDDNGNVVVVGNNSSTSQNSTSNNGCSCGCRNRCGVSVAQSSVANGYSDNSNSSSSYSRCGSQRTSCGCSY